MTAAESAEAVLIVIRRLAKWVLVAVVSLVLLGIISSGGYYALDWYKNRPFAATTYLGVSIGASRDEVYYALGQSAYFIDSSPRSKEQPAGRDFSAQLFGDVKTQKGDSAAPWANYL